MHMHTHIYTHAHILIPTCRELGVAQGELDLLSQRVRVRVVEEVARQRAVQEKVLVALRQKKQECAEVRVAWSVGVRGGGGNKKVSGDLRSQDKVNCKCEFAPSALIQGRGRL